LRTVASKKILVASQCERIESQFREIRQRELIKVERARYLPFFNLIRRFAARDLTQLTWSPALIPSLIAMHQSAHSLNDINASQQARLVQ